VGGRPLSYQPVLGLPTSGTLLIGAAPEEASEEVWAQGQLGAVPAIVGGAQIDNSTVLLRHTAGSDWQVVPIADSQGNQLSFTPASTPSSGDPSSSQVTADGGIALLGTEALGKPVLVTRDPGGAFALAPAPVAPALEEGQMLPDSGAIMAALEEGGRKTGALVVPRGGSSLAVLHYDASAWSREPICAHYSAGVCTPPSGQTQLLALAARSPQNAWLLAAEPLKPPALYERVAAAQAGAFVWVQQQPESWVFGSGAAPSGVSAQALAAGAGQMLTVTDRGVWVDVQISTAQQQGDATALVSSAAPGTVLGTWCYPQALCPGAGSLGAPLPSGPYESFAWPGAGSSADLGARILIGLPDGALLRFEGQGDFRYTVAGGGHAPKSAAFASAQAGWIGGESGVGLDGAQMVHVTEGPAPGQLQPWPLPFRRPLTAIAGQPGTAPADPGSQALAVGDQGQVARYVPGQGWSPEFLYSSAGRRQEPRLRGVAWPEPNRAYAVGDGGAMWLYNSETGLWGPDPATPYNFHGDLTAIAFSTTNPSVGYAVGKQGVLLAYDKTWTQQGLPPGLQQANLTSVTFAGAEALATYRMPVPGSSSSAGEVGGLIVNDGSGSGWHVDSSAQALLAQLPKATASVLSKVAGLPDGGAVAAGPGLVIERDSASSPWRFSTQPLPEAQNIAALAAIREGASVRALVSIDADATSNPNGSPIYEELDSPPAPALGQPPLLLGPDPLPVSGYLLREGDGGWQDLENQALPQPLPSGGNQDLPNWPDAVLALLVDPSGQQGWAVGGQTGGIIDLSAVKIPTPSGQLGSAQLTSQSAATLRLGSGPAPPQSGGAPILPAAGQAAFAIGGDAQCANPCADLANEGIGPDAWLSSAIARAGQVPGLHAFLYTGARVASDAAQSLLPDAFQRELSAYAGDLSGASLPVYVAASASDLDSGGGIEPFVSALGGAVPAGTAPPGTPPPPTGTAAYAFESAGAGGVVRVIVLDYSGSTLAPGELAWLGAQLAQAKTVAHVPAIVLGNRDVIDPAATNYASDGPVVAQTLTQGGASAYFFDSPERNLSEQIGSGAAAVPAFGSGTLGYVLPPPNSSEFLGASGFLLASIDVARRNGSTNQAPVSATLIPNISQLALDASDGVLLRRSQVALFEALARRPAGGLEVQGSGSSARTAPDPYVPIPETCQGAGCGRFIQPVYTFTSSHPDIGDFVEQDPSNANRRAVLEGPNGKPVIDHDSGLFCAFNPGTTTVSVQTGGLTYSEQVTVQGGSVQQPCGTVPLINPPAREVSANLGLAPLPPAAAAPESSPTPLSILPPAPPPVPLQVTPAPAPRPVSAPPPPFFSAPATTAALLVAPFPPPPIAARPTPPSGTSTVVSTSVAPKEEQEDEEAVENARANMAAYSPNDPKLPVVSLLALIVIAAGAGVGIRAASRGRRSRRVVAFARVEKIW
jgi:hypothetical protein